MDEHEWLAQQFEANRSHLQAVAYRMLGSLSEAEDAVQESWLHLSRSDTSGIENLGGWLTTVVARVGLDPARVHATHGARSLWKCPGPLRLVMVGSILSRRRSFPTRLVSPCSWSSTRFPPPSASRLCCMTSSPFLSTRSLPLWSVKSPRQSSSPAAHAAGCGERQQRKPPISPASERWSMPSLLPRTPVTSTRCSPSSTRMSCSEPTT